jgi:multiple antibiotic resistance protein
MEKAIGDALMLWATVDPIGTLVLFAALTAGLSPDQRQRIASKAILYAATILIAAIVLGQLILTGMGISLLSLQVAGGLILLLFGLQMIFGQAGARGATPPEAGHDMAVFPLAVPSIASPGAIMAAIVLTDNHIHPIGQQAITGCILLAVLAATWLMMRFADAILRVIGTNGAAILIRVMGMILAALSVELVMEAVGIEGWVSQPSR